jgi:hypothetical protein
MTTECCRIFENNIARSSTSTITVINCFQPFITRAIGAAVEGLCVEGAGALRRVCLVNRAGQYLEHMSSPQLSVGNIHQQAALNQRKRG